jgi:glutamyl-tRNA reductase
VTLKNIDDLKKTIEENLQKRWREAEKAEQIIVQELGRLDTQLGRILAEPLVSRICKKVEGIRQREIEKALRIIKGIDEKQRVVVEDLTKELVERILQIPAERLREAALNNDGNLLSAAEKLFNLETKKKGSS